MISNLNKLKTYLITQYFYKRIAQKNTSMILKINARFQLVIIGCVHGANVIIRYKTKGIEMCLMWSCNVLFKRII
jgi:hypothetical protein